MQWTDEVRIETPEQIDVELELAGLGTRFLAQLLDWLIKALLTAALALLVTVTAGLLGFSQAIESGSKLVLALGVVLGYLLWLGFDIFFEVRNNGQTPGKRSAGARVVREGGAPVDFQAACVRNLLGLADWLPMFYLLGALLILVTGKRQRLGDMAAGTLVIRERALDAPADVASQVEQFASPEYAFTASQLAACTPHDRQILRSFFQRHGQMDRDEQSRLALRLTELLQARMSYTPPAPIVSGQQGAVFLGSLLRDLEARSRRGY
jgi:uncharacterized RDD family membrane protein YckC